MITTHTQSIIFNIGGGKKQELNIINSIYDDGFLKSTFEVINGKFKMNTNNYLKAVRMLNYTDDQCKAQQAGLDGENFILLEPTQFAKAQGYMEEYHSLPHLGVVINDVKEKNEEELFYLFIWINGKKTDISHYPEK